MTPLVFLDCETTGLDPYRDDIWELAWITVDDLGRNEHQLFVSHDANRALELPAAFRADWATRFDPQAAVDPFDACKLLVDTIAPKAHLVGACPWFDQEFLRRAFNDAGLVFPWHYHLIDVEALAVGYLNGKDGVGREYSVSEPPWNSDELSRAVGVDPERFDRHTALGDCLWAEAIHQVVTG